SSQRPAPTSPPQFAALHESELVGQANAELIVLLKLFDDPIGQIIKIAGAGFVDSLVDLLPEMDDVGVLPNKVVSSAEIMG
ncbi:MAG: hypothetical protein WCL11_29970, partial [Verrucomicrobiota bacterium]